MIARDLVKRLVREAEMTPHEISLALAHRVSTRTVYRWLNGTSVPGNNYDMRALEDLVSTKLGKGVNGELLSASSE